MVRFGDLKKLILGGGIGNLWGACERLVVACVENENVRDEEGSTKGPENGQMDRGVNERSN